MVVKIDDISIASDNVVTDRYNDIMANSVYDILIFTNENRNSMAKNNNALICLFRSYCRRESLYNP